MSAKTNMATGVGRALRFAADVREMVPEIASALESASTAMRAGSGVLEQGAKILRRMEAERTARAAGERIKVTPVASSSARRDR